jgi:hypothetical protein
VINEGQIRISEQAESSVPASKNSEHISSSISLSTASFAGSLYSVIAQFGAVYSEIVTQFISDIRNWFILLCEDNSFLLCEDGTYLVLE